MKHILCTLIVALLPFQLLSQHMLAGIKVKQSDACDTSIVSLMVMPDFDMDSTNYLQNVDMDFPILLDGVTALDFLGMIDTLSFDISPLFDRIDTVPSGPLGTTSTYNRSYVDTLPINTSRNILTIELKLYALDKYQPTPVRLDSGQVARVVSFKVAHLSTDIGLTMDTVLWSVNDTHLSDAVDPNEHNRLISGQENQTLQGCFQTPSRGRISLKSSNYSNTNISVFPNPNSGFFTINVEQGVHTLEVYNLIGQLLWSSRVTGSTKLSLDLSTQNSGPLFLRAFDESMNLVDTQKILIVK